MLDASLSVWEGTLWGWLVLLFAATMLWRAAR